MFLIYVVDGFFCLVPFTDPVRVFLKYFLFDKIRYHPNNHEGQVNDARRNPRAT